MTVHHGVAKFVSAYNARNLEACLELFADNAILYGTGRDEERIGIVEIKAQFVRDWAQSEANSVITKDVTGAEFEKFAFAGANVNFRATINKLEYEWFGRLSFVWTRNEENRWEIIHLHASMPSEQARGQSFPIREAPPTVC